MKEKKINFREFFDKRTMHSILMTILGSMIYSFAVVWFLNSGEFFAGGITGISQLISHAILGKVTPILSLFIGIINFPLLLFGSRGVSKKFAFLTLLSVLLQMAFIASFQTLVSKNIFDPFKEFLRPNGVDFDNGARLVIAILGGCIVGIGNSMCLKTGGSSGGMDVIANYLLVKKNISFTKYSFSVDLIIIALSSLISIETALFTVIRLICANIVISRLYTSYKMTKLEIITSGEKLEVLRESILQHFHHGITIFDVVGGYTMEKHKLLEIIVSSYEVNEYIAFIEKIDPRAFIATSELKNLKGNYKKRTVI